MKIEKFKKFNESNEVIKIPKVKDIIGDICVSMLLLNNSFLDELLDSGTKKTRYVQNSGSFIEDLRNLVIKKNRLYIGKFNNNKCVEDDNTSIINTVLNNCEFDIEKDWNKLINYRIISRNIVDKTLNGDKLRSDMIKKIYLNITKDDEYNEDIVVELEDGRQFSFFLNKNFTLTKSSSFNTFGDDIIGEDMDVLYKEPYIKIWDKLAKDWVTLLYENSKKSVQLHISKFIAQNRIDDMSYFDYFNIKHSDPKFKNLGEYMKEFDKNILYLNELLSEVWKNREVCLENPDKIYKEWIEKKISLMNSKILEHIITASLTKRNIDDIEKLKDDYKKASGNLKMKFLKSIINKMGCKERPIYYLGNNGNIFYKVPERQFFRDKYDDITIKFDYHVKFVVSSVEENNDFVIKVNMEIDGKPLMDCDIVVTFTGGEMSDKLSAKFKFKPTDTFNMLVSKNND